MLTKVVEAMPQYDETVVSACDKCHKDTYK
jgi:hypothetical protein